MDNVDKTPENEAEGNGIESPVDGPTPDWMRLATSAGSSGSSLTDENMPAWLKSIRAGQGLSKDTPSAEPAKAAVQSSPEASDDSMSDLERLLAEEGIDLGSVEEERPEGAGDMSARDWLIATSSEEMIRNKIGAEPIPEQPAAPVPASTEASDDTMSDLERLLAEEGISLGSVEEERPEGAGDMSARDWLIATSSEEMIRNKLGAESIPEQPAAPLPSTPRSDDKMVVEEDLPDWLQDIADESAGAEPALTFETRPTGPSTSEDDHLVVAEELPDWLQDIADEVPPGADLEDFTSQPPLERAAAPVSSDEDKMVVREDLPDWLQEIADEPTGVESSSIDFETPPPSLAQTPMTSFIEDKMVIEEDLPDWLQDIAEEPMGADLTGSLSTDQDKMMVEEGLPDWLQEIAEEPHLIPEPNLPEVEAPVSASLGEDKMVVADDLPDWLREAAVESEPVVEPEFPAPLPAAAGVDRMVAEEDLPDWLREVEDGGTATEVALAQPDLGETAFDRDEIESDEDLPDWLREVEVSSLEDSLAMPPSKFAVETPPEPILAATIPSTEAEFDLLDDEDLPAWLKEVQERDAQETTADATRPIVAADSASDSSGPVAEEELPGWLHEVQDETAPLSIEKIEPIAQMDQPSDQMVIEEDLPDWLREEELADEPFEPSEPSPEVFVEAMAESELVMADELPDWLQEAEEEVAEEALFEAEIPTPAPTAPLSRLSADDMIEAEGLPDWLREAAAEQITEPLAVEEPLPIPEPLVAADDMIEAEGLPDWLREAAEEQIAEPVAAEEPLPTPEPLVAADDMIEAEGLPDWLREAAAEEAEPLPVPEPLAVGSEVADFVLAAVAEEEPESPTEAEEAVEVEEVGPISPAEPELAPVSEPTVIAPPSGGIPDWLQKLREADEEAPVLVPVAPAPPPMWVATPKPAPQPVYAQTVVTPAPDIPADAEERLQLARTARDKGDLDEAVRIYDSLVTRGVYLDKIIEDVKLSLKAHPNSYLLYQLMGDAMMRDGRLQSALNAYREALSRLS